MSRSRTCGSPGRLAVVWGAAAVALTFASVVVLSWSAGQTDSGMLCSPPSGGSDLACGLFDTWAWLLLVAAVLAGAALLAGVVAWAARLRDAATPGG